jgi:solute carrier family 25 S-adenosylmethionine transporter 26
MQSKSQANINEKSSLGETIACLVRVPTENLKQNLQVNRYASLRAAFQGLSKNGYSSFYNGYVSTLVREIPFSCIQFPLWEAGKELFRAEGAKECAPLPSAALGSVSGAFAAAVTTPLDGTLC